MTDVIMFLAVSHRDVLVLVLDLSIAVGGSVASLM